MRLRHVLVALTAFVLAVPAFAQREKLAVGQQAPGLDIEKWIRGEETALESGNVYIIEFWATDSLPCKKSIPHLSELQDRFGDDGLRVIGVSTEDEAVVTRFVTTQSDLMKYSVAVDRRQGTHRAWMQAAKLDDLPTAFIVDRSGKIQFIGSPSDGSFDDILKLVIAGRYDAKLFEKAVPKIEGARGSRKVRSWRMAEKHFDDLIEQDPHIFAMLQLEKFEMILCDQGEKDRAYQLVDKLLIDYADDGMFLAVLARKIATDPKIADADRDFDRAQRAADTAAKAVPSNNPNGFAIQALVNFHAGRIDEAIRLQKQAYFVARPRDKAQHQRILDTYRAAEGRASMEKPG